MRWQTCLSPTSASLHGVCVTAHGAFAVGARGTVLSWRDQAWHEERSGTQENLYAVRAHGRLVVAVGGDLHIGGNSLVLYRAADAERWVAEPSGMQHILLAVDHGARGWFAGGYNGGIIHGTPGSWSRIFEPFYQHIFAVCCVEDRVLFTGLSGSVIELIGDRAWPSTAGTDSHLRGIAASSTRHVIAVGLDGTIAARIDGKWRSMQAPCSEHLEAVWLRDEALGFAVGHGGTLLRFEDGTWDRMESPTAASFHDVHGFGDAVFAVGERGTICRLAPRGWRGG